MQKGYHTFQLWLQSNKKQACNRKGWKKDSTQSEDAYVSMVGL